MLSLRRATLPFIKNSLQSSPTPLIPVGTYSDKKPKPFDLSLYLVTGPSKNEEEFLHKVQRAIQGGVTCVQIRFTNEDHRATLKTARKLKKLMAGSGASLVINNRPDIALLLKADGVHLGQRDLPPEEVRRLVGNRCFIGLTVETMDQALEAQTRDIDYIGVQVFPSKNTKPESLVAWGPEGLSELKKFSQKRIVVIGGIDPDTIGSVSPHLDTERDGVAMVGRLWRSDDPYAVAQEMRSALDQMAQSKREGK